MGSDELRDQAYERFSCTGPEFDGWLSNHGPMAADALIRLGRGDVVEEWVGAYTKRLEDEPAPRWTIDDRGWREPLGDPSRLGDWLQFFAGRVHDRPWEDLLAQWWPRLQPGAIASSTHGLIRTGHAVRALRERLTPQRLDELGQALGYWAARWQPLPGVPAPSGTVGVDEAVEQLPIIEAEGGTRTRLARLAEIPAWSRVIGSARPAGSAAAVPGALDELVDLAVTRYRRWAHGSPVLLVHAATAPRAAALVLPSLPETMWTATYDMAWAVTATIIAAYRPAQDAQPSTTDAMDADAVVDRAVASGDEHAIKFVEVAVESNARGNADALAAGDRAGRLLGG